MGLQAYTNGVSQAAEGADELKDGTEEIKNGTEQLKDGSAELYDGVIEMKNSVPALIDGIKQIKDGSEQLKDGLSKFNEEGIQKLADIVNNNFGDLVARIRATKEVSLNYKSFAGIDDNTDGQVKFIYKTDGIEN